MNNLFKELISFEKNYVASSLTERRKNNKKTDSNEELREVVDEVKNIEGAM